MTPQIPASFLRHYAPLVAKADAYDQLVLEYADLAWDLHQMTERYAIAKGFLLQALRRAVAAETRLAQIAGVEPWHDDRS